MTEVQKLLAKQNLSLSKEYLDIAKFNLKYKKSYRGVIDTAYNAAELCAKGCLALKLETLPSTHKGTIQKIFRTLCKNKHCRTRSWQKTIQKFKIQKLGSL